ncbi:BatD family protein [Colwellia sp. D2M02]|uniref:BatD family protein n=1 Tax=Colwellia sp. D2M02 TaxID=2841562 RepID=UPI001C090FE4|nr:BatD family protein [Colwellia sp. D2M02]MBU2892069.1 BatD family protein [Colwellia sp. D2M02]
MSLLSSFFLCLPSYALSQVTASVDKNPVMVNESIVLTVIADDDVDQRALDTSPLLADFIVGRTSFRSYSSSINFKTTLTSQWQIVLIARRTGKHTIPALTVNSQKTAPISLVVLEKSDKDADQQDIFVTSTLSSSQTYVQQLFTLTLKLHFAVELKSGNLSEPSFPGAAIEKIGQDQQTSTIINGKRYRVIEQTYAITPQESGEFTIDAPVFSGDIMVASRGRSSFLSFAETKPVSVVGEPQSIKVLPIPLSYPPNTPWLPTEILTLHQEWPANEGEFTVGEPITRTITLTAAGLSKAQLPEIVMEHSKGFKVYPDQAQLHTNMTTDRLVSQKVQNFAIVPSQAGTFTLPELTVTWFNTVTNKTEQATLPAKEITVVAGENTLANNLANNQNSAQTNQQNNGLNTIQSSQSAQNNVQGSATTVVATSDNTMQWLFLGLWLLTLILWLVHVIYLKRQYSAAPKRQVTNKPTSLTTGNAYQQLVNACKKNDATTALSLIIPWLNQLIESDIITSKDSNNENKLVTNIAEVPTLINEQAFATALNDLQQHLYGKSATNGAPSWHGIALLAVITQINQKPNSDKSNQPWQLNP